jgi:hypothetical protein
MVASVKNPIHFSVLFTVPHLVNLQLQRNSKTVPKLFLTTIMQHGTVEYSKKHQKPACRFIIRLSLKK